MQRLLISALLILSNSALVAQVPSSEDELIISLFKDGKTTQLNEKIEAMFKSGKVDYLSIKAWKFLHRDELSQGARALYPQDVRDALSFAFAIDSLNGIYGGKVVLGMMRDQKYTSYIQFVNLRLLISLLADHDPEFTESLLFDLSLHGNYGYNIIRAYDVLISDHNTAKLKLKQRIESGQFKSIPEIENALSRLVIPSSSGNIERAGMAQEFLKAHPRDPFALKEFGDRLYNLEHFAEAASAYERAFESDPLSFSDNLLNAAKCYLMDQREDQADKTIRIHDKIYEASAGEENFLLHKAGVLNEAGNYGDALDILKRISSQKSKAEAEILHVDILIAAGADKEVLPLLLARIKAGSKRIPDYINLMRMYIKDSMFDKAIEISNLVRARFAYFTENYYYRNSELYSTMKDSVSRLQTVREWKDAFPYSGWALDNLVNAYRENQQVDSALLTSRDAFREGGFKGWRLNSMLKVLKESGQPFNEFAITDSLWKLDKQNEDACYARAALESGTKAKAEFWERTAAQFPNEVFPYANQRYEFNNDTKALYGLLAKMKAVQPVIMRSATPGLQAELEYQMAMCYVDIMHRNPITVDEAHEAIEHFNAYDRGNGYRSNIYSYKYEIYGAIREKDSAMAACLEGIKYSPDTRDLYWDLWTKYGYKNKIGIFKKLIQRNPFIEGPWIAYIKLNSMWEGSPVEAITSADYFLKTFPNSIYTDRIKGDRVNAYSRLGDNINDYLGNYKGRSSIGSSDRYINFYLSSVRQMRKGSTKVLINDSNCTALIRFEDGTEATYGSDCNCGLVNLLRVGPNALQFEYNKDCDLVKIASTDGYRCVLEYDEHGKISLVKSSDGEWIGFKYNQKGKPIMIWTAGDTLNVTYTDNGDIDKVKSSSGGTLGAQGVVSLMNRLLNKVKIPQSALKEILNARLPDLGLNDKIHDSLNTLFNDAPKGKAAWVKAGIEYSAYLMNNRKVKSSYNYESLDALKEIYSVIRDKKSFSNECKTVIDMFYTSLMTIRKSEIAGDYWNTWIQMQEWMKSALVLQHSNKAFTASVVSMMDKYNKNPVVLIRQNMWLEKSSLKNSALWREIPLSDIIPNQASQVINDIAYDWDDQVWLMTSKGIYIDHKGLWEHYAYDARKSKFTRNPAVSSIGTGSDIHKVIFLNDSVILMATATGLLKVTGTELGKARVEKLGELGGLSSDMVNDICLVYDRLWVATKNGVDIVSTGDFQVLGSYLKNNDIDNIRFKPHRDQAEGLSKNYNVLAGIRGRGILGAEVSREAWTGIIFDTLFTGNYDHLNFDENGRIILSVKDELSFIKQDPETKKTFTITLNGNIKTTAAKQVYDLVNMTVDLLHPPAALTDLGISIYRDNHFEYLDIPNMDQKPIPVNCLAVNEMGGMTLVCGDRLLIFEKDLVNYNDSRVSSLLNMDSLDMTLVADGGLLKYYKYNGDELEYFPSSYSAISLLARESDTSFIANSGKNIIRFRVDKATHRVQTDELFYCSQTESEGGEYTSGKMKNIIVDRTGTIWVAAGLSVFRYSDKDSLTEFNFFKDPAAFPSYTEMVYKVMETIDGKIWVVCSDEGHLDYRSIPLDGGLLQYDEAEKKFVNLTINKSSKYDMPFNWFVTSYTAIDSTHAILGSAGGFAEEEHHNINAFDAGTTPRNASYARMKKQFPSLFLGTEGINLGGIWLFGSASGVVCYANGNWFYPERFNQLLPKDLEWGQYGGRLVNALAVDRYGRIFVGTDLGLMVYNTGGKDPASFLIRNFNVSDALAYRDQAQLQNEKDAIINSISPTSGAGAILTKYKEAEHRIARLEESKSSYQREMMLNKKGTVNIDSINKAQDEVMQEQVRLLLKLEQSDPALFQLLKVPPLDLISTRKKLKDDECMVQYIPMASSIGIQYISKQKISFREIRIDQRALMDSVMKAVHLISVLPGDTARGSELVGTATWEGSPEYLLNFLYGILIEPVANDIKPFKNVYIIPYGKLYYLPFAALSYTDQSGKARYLAEDHNIGFISTISLSDLVFNYKSTGTGAAYRFADPDGSLRYARQEVSNLKAMAPNSVNFIGKEATVAKLMEIAPSCGTLHLATHGHLDKGKVNESWILFADKKLTMDLIFTTRFTNTSLVVLSTCESALGAEGIEYATLARAFANAGVPTVVSTLWEIDDEATNAIMVDFYANLAKGMGKFEALAQAQRNYITKNAQSKKTSPYYWAPFIVLGKP